MTNQMMRVSDRFYKVAHLVSGKLRLSLPAVTELILEGYLKGSLIIFGKPAEIKKIIDNEPWVRERLVDEKKIKGANPVENVPENITQTDANKRTT